MKRRSAKQTRYADQSIGIELMIEDMRKEIELWKNLYHAEVQKQNHITVSGAIKRLFQRYTKMVIYTFILTFIILAVSIIPMEG